MSYCAMPGHCNVTSNPRHRIDADTPLIEIYIMAQTQLCHNVTAVVVVFRLLLLLLVLTHYSCTIPPQFLQSYQQCSEWMSE